MPRYVHPDDIVLDEPAPRYVDPADLAPDDANDGTWLDWGVTTGLRVLPSIAGTVGGGALGGIAGAAVGGIGAVPGAAGGAVIGGGLGGGAGEYLAEKYEQMRGLREDVSPGAVGVEAALGAIPLGKSATVARAGLKGAAMAGAGTVAHSVVEQGELPSAKHAAISGALGFLFGAGGEKIARRFGGAGTRAAERATATDSIGEQAARDQAALDDIAAMRDVDARIQSEPAGVASPGIGVQPARDTYVAGAGEADYLRAQREADARTRGRVSSPGLRRYVNADEVIQDDIAAPRATITNEPARSLTSILRGEPEPYAPDIAAALDDIRSQRAAPAPVTPEAPAAPVPTRPRSRPVAPDEITQNVDAFATREEARRAADEMFESDVVGGVGRPAPYEQPSLARFLNGGPLPEPPIDAAPAPPTGGGGPPPSPAAPPVDVLDTGEIQPRLPEAGRVRDAEIATPVEEAPFALAQEVSRAPGPLQQLLGMEPSSSWERGEAERAVREGYPGTVDEAEAEIVRRTRELHDSTHETGGGPRDFLQAVARHGGLDLDDPHLSGEMAWLGEMRDREGRGAFGTVGGVANVLRRGGRRADTMAEVLGESSPLFRGIERDQVIERVGDAARQKERPASFAPERYGEAVGIRPGARWWDDAPSFVNELDPEWIDEPGIAGRLSNELATTVGGGVAGGVIGASQGETPEERLEYGALGAGAGALGGAGLARLLARRAGGPAPTAPTGEAPRVPSSGLIPRRTQIATPTGTLSKAQGDRPTFRTTEPAATIPAVRPMPAAQRESFGLDHFPEDQRDAIGSLIAEYGVNNLETQRRGRQSIARQEALASRMTLDVSKPHAPGTNLSAEGHRAFKNALVSTIERGRELGLKQRDGLATDADVFELGKVDTARRALLASYYGLRSEAGRALAAYNGMARVMPSEIKIVNELLSQGRLRKDMAELGDVMANLPADPDEAIKVLQSKEVHSIGDTVANYFTSNLVSGLVTQQRNLFSNAFRAASRVALKAGSGPYDAVRAMVTNTPREVYSTEAIHEISGGFASLQKAWQDAAFTARHGYSTEALHSGLADVTDLYVPPKEMIGGGANPLNYPRRGLDAVDRFFRQVNSGMELYARTYADARKAATAEGLTGDALSDAIAERATHARLNPSKDLQRAVASAAERGVYQENAGPVTNAILSLRRRVPALGYVLPFVRTPANIFKQGMEASPLGFVMSRARSADPRTRSIAQAEAFLGTATLAPLAYLAATERLSGSGPTDPAQRNALYETGWRPHSVRLALPDDAAKAVGASPSGDGEYWVSYSLFQPVAIPASIVADGFEAWRDVNRAATRSTKEQRALQTASQVVARVGKSALDQSYLSGLGDLLEAVNDPERAAEGFVSRTAQGFVPFSGALRNVARQADPIVRAPEGFGESIEANLPGLSRNVAPRLDRWGREVSREPQSSPSFAMDVSPTTHDPVADELQRLGIDIGMPSARLTRNETKGWTQRQLTRDEAFTIRQVRGQSTRAILGVLMGAPGYESMPDIVKVQLIHRMIRQGSADVNDVARIAMQLNRPDILQMIARPPDEAGAGR